MDASGKPNHVSSAETARDIITSSGQIQPLKIPDAVAALAQAAAKANGETEKYLPGWPLFSPPKVQLDKCTKCSREFCSAVNFRRHSRVHRRTLKMDKDFPKNRDLLAAFWNRLTLYDARTILSLTGVVIEGVTGSSVLTTLSSWMCKPGYASLPMAYARAGSELLDLIQTKASMCLRVSSDELFSLLDEASEKTFLCTNTDACIQKFLFDGEVDKIAAELKNVVSCVSYMLEQKLVEAWCADKTAEALRCQKLLVQEEEAAHKRQAELMEKKRLKKLRQKEQRLKNLKDEDMTVQSPEIMDDATCSTTIQSAKSISDPDRFEQEESRYLQFPATITSETDNGFNVDLLVEDISGDLGPGLDKGVEVRQHISRRRLGRTERLAENSIVPGPVVTSKHSAFVRPSNYKDPNVCSAPSRNKTCTMKLPVQSPEIKDDATCSTAIQSAKSISDPDCFEQEESQYLQFPATITSETDNGFSVDLLVEDISGDLGPGLDKGVEVRQHISRRRLGRTEGLAENSIVPGPVVTSKHPAFVRPSNYKDPNVCSAPSRNKTCTMKLQSEIEEQCQNHELNVDEHGMGPSKNSRVLIGSISVAIEDGSERLQDFGSKNDPVPPSSKTVKHASVKVMQPVTHEGNRNEGIPHSDSNSMASAENLSHSSVTTNEISYSTICSADLVEDEHLQCTMFSIKEATAFLSQRWKEAIAADHVKLVLCTEK